MRHLARLIDDLLDVSRITRGKIELRREVARRRPPSSSSAAATVEAAHRGAEAHASTIAIDRGDSVGRRRPDPAGAGRGEPPEQRGQVQRERRAHPALGPASRGTRSSSRVEDNGIGIPPEKLPQMFELFAQGDRSLARSEGGLGIGLTVVKKLVEMHGGTRRGHERGARQGERVHGPAPGGREPPAGRRRGRRPARPEARRSRLESSSSMTTWTRPAGMARLLKLLGHEVRGRPRRPRGASRRRRSTGPSSCSSTSACPAWTATRSPAAPAGGVLQGRRHHRRLGLRPGRGPPPLEEGGLRPSPRQAARPRCLALAPLGWDERPLKSVTRVSRCGPVDRETQE